MKCQIQYHYLIVYKLQTQVNVINLKLLTKIVMDTLIKNLIGRFSVVIPYPFKFEGIEVTKRNKRE